MRQIYAERLSVLLEGAKEKWSGLAEITGVEAGLQTAAWLGEGIQAGTVAQTAKLRNVEAVPLQEYSQRPMRRQGLQLGFAAVDTREIRRGVHELAVVMEECRKQNKRVEA